MVSIYNLVESFSSHYYSENSTFLKVLTSYLIIHGSPYPSTWGESLKYLRYLFFWRNILKKKSFKMLSLMFWINFCYFCWKKCPFRHILFVGLILAKFFFSPNVHPWYLTFGQICLKKGQNIHEPAPNRSNLTHYY